MTQFGMLVSTTLLIIVNHRLFTHFLLAACEVYECKINERGKVKLTFFVLWVYVCFLPSFISVQFTHPNPVRVLVLISLEMVVAQDRPFAFSLTPKNNPYLCLRERVINYIEISFS